MITLQLPEGPFLARLLEVNFTNLQFGSVRSCRSAGIVFVLIAT